MKSLSNNCLNCNSPAVAKFCSRSCSASYNNRLYPRRQPQIHTCSYCKESFAGRRAAKCPKCIKENALDQRTIGEFIFNAKYQVNAQLRQKARESYKRSSQPDFCMICKYNKHIEIAHIKDLNSYPTTATVAETCKIDNLLGLCPNCHWEFDHDLL